jgi:glycosyltransferase involved in cell wall biosynthesis
MNVDVSVIIPTYNRAHCVDLAIDSVLAQTSAAVEIIVVDDGSTDETAQMLAKYGDAIHVIRQANQGVAAARNAGIQAAQSKWIAFLDSDDEWEPDKIARQSESLSSDSNVVAHVTNGWVYTANSSEPVDWFSVRGLSSSQNIPLHVADPLRWVLATLFMTPGLVARKDAVAAVGGFDTSLCMFEDLDLLARLALHGAFGIDRTPLFRVYRRGPTGTSLTEQCAASVDRMARSLSYVYSKLLRCPGLTQTDLRDLRRRLSARRADVAVAERAELGVLESLPTFTRSIRDYPSITAGVRAAAGLLGGVKAIEWLRRCRHGSSTFGCAR